MSQSSTLSSKRYVIIIGAGIYGLTAAKTYLEINPDVDLTIVDNGDSIGGVWSKSRIYPGLVTDAPVPIFDLSDLEMSKEFNVPEWSDIPGTQMHEYLERYAQKFDILKRCIFNTEVTNVERNGKGWKVHTKKVGDQPDVKMETLNCDVLIVATGQFSIPKFPDVDTTSFEGKVLHTRDFNKYVSELSSESVQSVAVYGGNKSAFEVVTACYRAGKNVHWLIREDGAGPGMLLKASLPDGTSTARLGFMRVTSITLPQVYRETRSWLDRFLLSGRNALGRRICDLFWKKTTAKRIGDQYEEGENMKRLKPDILSLFWFASGLSFVHNRDLDVVDAIAKGDRIHVARTSITSAKSHTLSLSNQEPPEVDALIFATGWEPPTDRLFAPSLKVQLGLPVPWSTLPGSVQEYWRALDASADRETLDIYPIFTNPPYKYPHRDRTDTPFRLFRAIVPPMLAAENDRSIVFLGQLQNVQHSNVAEISALWSVAYLENLLPSLPVMASEESMNREVARVNAFMQRRYPGRKNQPLAILEVRDWMDVLLRDLGVRPDRIRLAVEREGSWGWFGLKGWWAEWFTPYRPVVYKGIVGEFLEGVRRREEGKKVV